MASIRTQVFKESYAHEAHRSYVGEHRHLPNAVLHAVKNARELEQVEKEQRAFWAMAAEEMKQGQFLKII